MLRLILALMLLLTPSLSEAVTCDDAVGCWLFTEGSGTTVADSSPNTNTGNFKGSGEPSWASISGTSAPTYADYSVDFDGTNDYISCGSDAPLDDLNASTMSVSTWVDFDAIDSTDRRIIAKQSTASGNLTGWSLLVNTTDKLLFSTAYTTTNGSWAWDGDVSTSDGWYHIAFTYDGSSTSNDPIVYVDGNLKTLDSDNNPSGTIRSSAAYNLRLGNFDNLERPFDGQMTETAIFDVILTSTEINDIINDGLADIATAGIHIIGNNFILNNGGVF